MKRWSRMNKVCVAGIVLCAGMALAGCKQTEALPEQPVIASEMEPAEASEPVSEMGDMETEETEEASEEEADVYSAEAMIAMMDELTDRYQYNDPDQMRSVIILLNVDYISEENRQAILDHYGYTYEDLSGLFIKYLYDYNECYHLSGKYYDHVDGVVLPTEKDIKKRFNIEDAILRQEDKDMCGEYFDRNVTNMLSSEIRDAMIRRTLPNIDETCSQTIIDIILQEGGGEVNFTNQYFANPYDKLMNE